MIGGNAPGNVKCDDAFEGRDCRAVAVVVRLVGG